MDKPVEAVILKSKQGADLRVWGFAMVRVCVHAWLYMSISEFFVIDWVPVVVCGPCIGRGDITSSEN